jgi:RHH-type proline utilization regulon transcriptional repressor/proline dehydrogenase/delta 1-pyrroline-5-carboxylate dehydrogenase
MSLAPSRTAIHSAHLAPEAQVLTALSTNAPSLAQRQAAVAHASKLVTAIRADDRPALMDVFLAEYGLSTREGVALMCLAEALLRVPDADTMDALIEDKIAPSAWGAHLGKSSSSLVNASTWALMLTGKVLSDGEGMAGVLRGAVKRLGEPVIRTAVGRAMREMGAQFVLGETISEAVSRGRSSAAKGYTYSYDMLGEAAMTARDADAFLAAYNGAIKTLAAEAKSSDLRDNPGISIKLSALHPRYEFAQKARVMEELVPRVLGLAQAAKAARMGLNIDAEEADRLELSLDVIEAVLSDESLAGWDGFGVVVQAYGKRAAPVIDWLYALAQDLDRRIMVRLVKGAYWDTEIKHAQVEGFDDFAVFTRKVATDVSFQCCAAKLLAMTDRIYPQFATHNAQTVAAILAMTSARATFEFQRLHGMGRALYDVLRADDPVRCRIYAPVGAHRDLLAYLVRRLLENGANSSFVNQIVDTRVPPAVVAADPFAALEASGGGTAVTLPKDIFGGRRNSQGWNVNEVGDVERLDALRAPYRGVTWHGQTEGTGDARQVWNPAVPADLLGEVRLVSVADVQAAFEAATPWAADAPARAEVLRRVADAYEANTGELLALLSREAGKTLRDGVSEIREAVDFLRFYGDEAARLSAPARGVFGCISPWNFPLAIFTGQIAAALAAGNAVLAKPAETTLLTADFAVGLMHAAGVPRAALRLLPGDGADVGAALSALPLDGICFTGSTATAQRINRTMAANASPTAPLIAETGGQNAMIVDSTALPEQAVRDIVASAFQSAGQRCSALRVLYVQKDVAETVLSMLYGAMDELAIGDPWQVSTDIGPVITAQARAGIEAHIAAAQAEGRVLKALAVPSAGHFVAPTVIKVTGIGDLAQEVFGPVLHVATYKARDLDKVVAKINAAGYGLTFGMHSRIDDRVEQVVGQIRCGNIYINRNQIGAVVGSQPFGGEGLSGTGPKAGGPQYVARFARAGRVVVEGDSVSGADVQAELDAVTRPTHQALRAHSLPGPTGESNLLSVYGRGVVLCLGPGALATTQQVTAAKRAGCSAAPAQVSAQALTTLTGFDAVASFAPDATLKAYRQALAVRDGALIPLLAEDDLIERLTLERHLCVDTTAAGGNVALLSQSS